jgi:hypothetical protein
MRRREFIGSIGAVSMLPPAVWSQQVSYDVSDSAPAGTVPLTYNDPRFNGNTNSNAVSLSKGQTCSQKSITDSGGIASILMNGNNTVDTCRVNSRESVRVGGAGTFTITNCYLEAHGQGSDHADVIQAYAPGSRGTITVRNSRIVLGTTAANNCGLFVADNWTGTIDLQDVVFSGGNYGLRCHPDAGGDNIIKLKNVFFVPPFTYGEYLIGDYGRHKNIIQLWDNVRNATIVNGALVPSSVIRKPF